MPWAFSDSSSPVLWVFLKVPGTMSHRRMVPAEKPDDSLAPGTPPFSSSSSSESPASPSGPLAWEGAPDPGRGPEFRDHPLA